MVRYSILYKCKQCCIFTNWFSRNSLISTTEGCDCVLSSHEEARTTYSQLNMTSSQKDTRTPSQQTMDTSEQNHNKPGEHAYNRNIESHYVAGQPIFYNAQTHSSRHFLFYFFYVGTASRHGKSRTTNMLKYSCNTKWI